MQFFRAHVSTFCVLSIAFSLLAPGHADFSFNFSTGDTASNFFFLLSNTTSRPTFAAPFGTSGQFLNLTRDKQQTAHAMWWAAACFPNQLFVTHRAGTAICNSLMTDSISRSNFASLTAPSSAPMVSLLSYNLLPWVRSTLSSPTPPIFAPLVLHLQAVYRILR